MDDSSCRVYRHHTNNGCHCAGMYEDCWISHQYANINTLQPATSSTLTMAETEHAEHAERAAPTLKTAFFFFFCELHVLRSLVPFWNVMLISCTCVGVFQLEESFRAATDICSTVVCGVLGGRLLTLQWRDTQAYLWEAKTNERWMER